MHDPIDSERLRKLLLAYPAKAILYLYDLYFDHLVTISGKLTHNDKASQDIVQETFIHVWERYEWLGQQHDQSIERYLLKVVRNKSITYYKKNLRISESRIKYFQDNPENLVEDSAEVGWIVLEVRNEIRRVISTFPPREKECYLMSRDENMSNEQIAQRLKISSKAVERCITSANKRLKKHFFKP